MAVSHPLTPPRGNQLPCLSPIPIPCACISEHIVWTGSYVHLLQDFICEKIYFIDTSLFCFVGGEHFKSTISFNQQLKTEETQLLLLPQVLLVGCICGVANGLHPSYLPTPPACLDVLEGPCTMRQTVASHTREPMSCTRSPGPLKAERLLDRAAQAVGDCALALWTVLKGGFGTHGPCECPRARPVPWRFWKSLPPANTLLRRTRGLCTRHCCVRWSQNRIALAF